MVQDANEWKTFITRANQLFRATVHPAVVQLPVEGSLPSLGGATEWLNSPPLTAAGLRGRVVAVDFWTYTCINWLRTLPYLRAWAERYQDHGLVVLGVHTPEFDFEHDLDNVRRAATDLRVGYPIAVDNDYAIWDAFNNHYWPALYFVDTQGQIRHHQFGEGDYQQSEMILQQLLTEAGVGGIGPDLVAVDAGGVEAAADWASLRSPGNYVGYERTENFASPGGVVLDTRHVYAAPARLRLNHWALAGAWTVQRQVTVLHQAEGRIAYRFHARDLHLVMGPAARGTAVRFRVRIDGQPPGDAHGGDVDDQGNGTATQQRLYQLIRQRGPVTEHTFEITFLDPAFRPTHSPSAGSARTCPRGSESKSSPSDVLARLGSRRDPRRRLIRGRRHYGPRRKCPPRRRSVLVAEIWSASCRAAL
jgi:thiol-disulfide isomerase/thioredoxin